MRTVADVSADAGIVAIVEIVITSIIALLPTSSGGVPWMTGFAWKYVNYTIIVVPAALILLWVWWHVSVKHWFTGPKRTVGLPEGMTAADERSTITGIFPRRTSLRRTAPILLTDSSARCRSWLPIAC